MNVVKAWRSPNLGTLLVIAAVALTTAVVSLTTLNHVKDVVIAADLRGQKINLALLVGSLGTEDAICFVPAVVAMLALLWLELRHRGCSLLLTTASSTEAFVLLTILVAWFGHSYLSAGVLLGGDTGTHISRFLEVARGLDAGKLAQWTNYQYAGAPLLWFTGPLTYIVGGLIAFIVRDAILATKILLFVLHIMSGWVFFAFMRRLGVRPVPAMLAAAGFAGSFAHLHLFLYRGVIPQAFTIVFLVLLFHAADGLLRGKGARWANVLIFALTTTAMIVNHQPHALFAAFYLAVFGALALLLGFWRWQGVPALVAAGLLGVIASAIAVIPVLFEADWVMIEPETAPFRVHLPTLHRLLSLVLWRDTRTTWGIDYWAYLGIGLVAFAVAGIVRLFIGRPRTGMSGVAPPACVCLAICLVLYNPVVRDVMFLLFFVGLLAALGLDWLIDRPVLAGRRLLLATFVMTVDLASTSVQPVARNDKQFLADAGRQLERVAPDQRVVQIGVSRDGVLGADMGPDGGPLSYYATVQRVAGNHNMAATRIHNFLVSTVKLAEAELRASGELSPETKAFLGLFNVGRIICNTPIENGCPASIVGAGDDTVLGRFIPVIATPVLFSQHLITLLIPAELEKPMLWPDDYLSAASRPRISAITGALHEFLNVENPDLPRHTAQAIAIQDATPAPGNSTGFPPWHPVLRNYAVGLDTIELRIESDGNGYVQLAHPWFPSTTVTVNGTPIQPLRGAIELIVVPVQQGINVIRLSEGWTRARLISALISGFGLVAILSTTVMIARRDRPRR